MKAINRLLLLTMGGVISSVSQVCAFTVDELCDPTNIAVDRLHWAFTDGKDDPWNNGPLGSSNEVKFEKVYNSNAGRYYNDRVILRGIIFNPYSTDLQGMLPTSTKSVAFQFMLADDDNEVTTDGNGTRLILDCGHYYSSYGGKIYFNFTDIDSERYSLLQGVKWDYGTALGDDPEIVYSFRKENMSNAGNWVGQISRDDDGNLHVDFTEKDKAVIIVDTYDSEELTSIVKGSVLGTYHHRIIDGYHIDFHKFNATLEGKVAAYNKQDNTHGTFSTPVAHEPYNCWINFTGTQYGSQLFEIVNLTRNGYSVQPDEETTFKQGAITGGYFAANNEVWLDGGQVVANSNRTSNSSYAYYRHYPYSLQMANIYRNNSQKTFDFDDVVGTLNSTGGLAHRLRTTHWVTNGGNLRTFENAMGMTLPDFGYVWEMDEVLSGSPMVRYEYSPCYCDNVLGIYEGDVTVELDHYLNRLGVSSDGSIILVESTVTPIANTQYVESYELWMMPTQTSMDVTGGDFAHDNGHSKAVLMAKHIPAPAKDIAESASIKAATHDAFKFYRDIETKDLPSTSISRKGDYSVYVKVNYKPETGLHPTFHNLLMKSDAEENPTGIDQVEGNNAVSIICETSPGYIHVISADGSAVDADVYTPQGTLVYQGAGSEIAVAPGLYIVKAAGTAEKVLVK